MYFGVKGAFKKKCRVSQPKMVISKITKGDPLARQGVESLRGEESLVKTLMNAHVTVFAILNLPRLQ